MAQSTVDKSRTGTRKKAKTGGRVAGTPNKATAEFRQTVTRLLEDNADNVATWLKTVAEGDEKAEIKPDPYKALDMLAKLAEYATPKLARQEFSGQAAVHHTFGWPE